MSLLDIHTKSTEPYPMDVNFGISIRNPQTDIPWMSISEYPYEIHRTISHGCQFRNIHTKSTDRYPVDVPSGYPYEIHRTKSHGCQFRNIQQKPQTNIPSMSLSANPYQIHIPY